MEVPSRNVGRVIGRKGETVSNNLPPLEVQDLNFTIRLVVTKPLLALQDSLSLVVLGEVNQQGQQVQGGSGTRDQGLNDILSIQYLNLLSGI